MAQLNLPSVTETVANAQSARVSINGNVYTSVQNFAFNANLERGQLRGTATKVLAFTDPNESYDGSFALPVGDAQAFIDDIVDSQAQFGNASFDIALVYKTRTSSRTFARILKGCVITAINESLDVGGVEPTLTTFNFVCVNIDYMGDGGYATAYKSVD